MNASRRGIASVALALLASCGDDPIGPVPAPELEPVTFGLIGNARVMFSRFGAINQPSGYGGHYVIDGVEERSFVLPSGFALAATLSRDGERVAVRQWTDFNFGYDIFVMDLAGANRARMTQHPGNSENPPSWTNGGMLVYSVAEFVDFRIMLRTSGTDATELHHVTIPMGTAITCPYSNGGADRGPVTANAALGVVYSCDGREVVGARTQLDTLETWYVAADTAEIHSPIWSPTADEIAFMELIRGPAGIRRSVLRILTLSTGAARIVASIPAVANNKWGTASFLSVCWLPNGRLLFNAPGTSPSTSGAPRGSLYVVEPDGTGLTQFTTREDTYDHEVSCSGPR